MCYLLRQGSLLALVSVNIDRETKDQFSKINRKVKITATH